MKKQLVVVPRSPKPVVNVCSPHPLVLHFIMNQLETYPGAPWTMKAISIASGAPEIKQPNGIIIFDIHSIQRWEHVLRRWITMGLGPIAVVPESFDSKKRLRLLELGTRGIVEISPYFARDIAGAVKSVVNGKLWIDHALLEKFVTYTNAVLKRLPGVDDGLTSREHEVLQLLLQEYTNKQIATLLGISERTVKFHVSNILQKTRTDTRQVLVHYTSSAGVEDSLLQVH